MRSISIILALALAASAIDTNLRNTALLKNDYLDASNLSLLEVDKQGSMTDTRDMPDMPLIPDSETYVYKDEEETEEEEIEDDSAPGDAFELAKSQLGDKDTAEDEREASNI
jgi:hypothetical protein